MFHRFRVVGKGVQDLELARRHVPEAVPEVIEQCRSFDVGHSRPRQCPDCYSELEGGLIDFHT